MRSILLAFRSVDALERNRPVSPLYIWGPAVLAAIVIAVESTSTFSADNTSGWLRPIVQAVLGTLSDARWALLHHLIRKSGHFGGYGGVCVAFVRAWLWHDLPRAAHNLRRWRGLAVLRGLACTALIASLDEWHQTFLPTRTGRFADVVLDTCGGAVACALLALLFWRRDASS